MECHPGEVTFTLGRHCSGVWVLLLYLRLPSCSKKTSALASVVPRSKPSGRTTSRASFTFYFCSGASVARLGLRAGRLSSAEVRGPV